MSEGANTNSTASIARSVAARILWEMEFGVSGYPQTTPSSTAIQAPTASPSKMSEKRAAAPPSVPPESSDTDPAAALHALHSAIGDCTRCELHRGRTNLVFGEGNAHARLVFVGEGPGRDEDLAGRPFVGAAGQLLDRIIEAMGLTRGDVYICNVVKCRPPNNRTPQESETNICGGFLRRQLAVIRPSVIVALGGTAATYLLGGPQAITRIRGQFQTLDGIPLRPTYHPAYLLRNPAEKRAVWNDMQRVMERLGLERKKS